MSCCGQLLVPPPYDLYGLSSRLIIGNAISRPKKLDAASRGRNYQLGTITTNSSPSSSTPSSSQRHTLAAPNQSLHPLQLYRPGAPDCANTPCTVVTPVPRVPRLQLYATRASRESRTSDSPGQSLLHLFLPAWPPSP